MRRPILVTGGAGYIGSHACKALAAAGFLPVTFDSLVTGWREAVKFGPFEQGDLRDRDRLRAVFARYRPSAVMHFAALSEIGEANRAPGLYWDNNVIGTLRLLEEMTTARVPHLVFSSTGAIYDAQGDRPLEETAPQAPLNAYGASKRAAEDLILNFAAAPESGLSYVIFRYFNVAGADPAAEIGECHRPETHLIPLALAAATGQRPLLTINGQDYPTRDGTCVRDYVHVCDLIQAHLLGLDYLQKGGTSELFNLGSGQGVSVKEVMEAVAQVTGQAFPACEGPRRPGDCASLVAQSRKAQTVLGWNAEQSQLENMITSAWAWQKQPGYAR